MNFQSEFEGPKIGWFTRLLIKIASAAEATLRICPPHDLSHVKATAELLLLTAFYQAGLYSMVAHRLFAAPGEFRPELVLGALFLAIFIMRIDSFCVVGSQWHLSGIEEIKRGGLDISGGWEARIKARVFLACRILLSLALAQLTALFAAIMIFHTDSEQQIKFQYLRANSRVIAEATALVDSNIGRATEAVAAQTAQVNSLSVQVRALRENEIDPSSNPQTKQAQEEIAHILAQKAKTDDDVRAAEVFATNEEGGIKSADGNSGIAGDGPRHKAAMTQVAIARRFAQNVDHELGAARERLRDLRKQTSSEGEATQQQSRMRLPEFEAALDSENARLSNLKGQLAATVRGRDEEIADAVAHAPNHVALDDGLLAQIAALESVAETKPRAAGIIALIDLISFALELAAVLSTVTSFVPTTYAALIARDAFLRAIHMADEISRELDLIDRMADVPTPPRNRPPSSGDGNIGPIILGPGPTSPSNDPPPKRPRGRPRKHPPN